MKVNIYNLACLRLTQQRGKCQFLRTGTMLLKHSAWHSLGATSRILHWQFINSAANPLTLLPLKRHQLFPPLTLPIPLSQASKPVTSG